MRYRKRTMGRIQILGVLLLIFFSFIFLYTSPTDFEDLNKQIDQLNRDTQLGWKEIDRLEETLADVDNVEPLSNVSYVVFNRVPKCGSMFLTTLCYKLGSQNKFNVESPYEIGEKPQKTATEQRKFIDELYTLPSPNMYIRHQWFVNFQEFHSNNPVYINLIRDPISRFESFYYFSRFGNNKGGGGQAALTDELKNESVDECVHNRRKECVMPYWQVVPYFCGQDTRCAQRTQWAVDRAKDNVERHYLFVGTLEDLELTLKILEKLIPGYFSGAQELSTQGPSEKMKLETQTKSKRESSEATKMFLKEETSLRYEYQLYDFIRHRMAAIKHKFNL